MDLQSLSIILKAALSPNPDERTAAEGRLDQLQHTPQHLLRLLQIVVDGNYDMGVRQVASINFKNFISKNWSPNDPVEQSQILPSDKDLVRQNLLIFVIQVPPLLRVQLGECLKTIIHADYPEQWPSLLQWVKHNLQDQAQQMYGALFVLRILSRKYESLELLTMAIPQELYPRQWPSSRTISKTMAIPQELYPSQDNVHVLIF